MSLRATYGESCRIWWVSLHSATTSGECRYLPQPRLVNRATATFAIASQAVAGRSEAKAHARNPQRAYGTLEACGPRGCRLWPCAFASLRPATRQGKSGDSNQLFAQAAVCQGADSGLVQSSVVESGTLVSPFHFAARIGLMARNRRSSLVACIPEGLHPKSKPLVRKNVLSAPRATVSERSGVFH